MFLNTIYGGRELMGKFIIPDVDQRQIAHHIAQRGLTTIGSGEPNRALDTYLEIYNNTLKKLKIYNSDATEL